MLLKVGFVAYPEGFAGIAWSSEYAQVFATSFDKVYHLLMIEYGFRRDMDDIEFFHVVAVAFDGVPAFFYDAIAVFPAIVTVVLAVIVVVCGIVNVYRAVAMCAYYVVFAGTVSTYLDLMSVYICGVAYVAVSDIGSAFAAAGVVVVNAIFADYIAFFRFVRLNVLIIYCFAAAIAYKQMFFTVFTNDMAVEVANFFFGQYATAVFASVFFRHCHCRLPLFFFLKIDR